MIENRDHTELNPFKMLVHELDEGLRNLRTVASKDNAVEFNKVHLLYRYAASCKVANPSYNSKQIHQDALSCLAGAFGESRSIPAP